MTNELLELNQLKRYVDNLFNGGFLKRETYNEISIAIKKRYVELLQQEENKEYAK